MTEYGVLVGWETGAYSLRAVSGGSGLPSSFSTGYISCWFVGYESLIDTASSAANLFSIEQLQFFMNVVLYDTDGVVIGGGSFPLTTEQNNSFLIRLITVAFDTSAQIIKVYFNNTELISSDFVWNSTNPVSNPGGADCELFLGVGSAIVRAGGYFNDLWIKVGGSFLDPDLILDRFITADGLPVDLGSSGQTPTGTSPQIFLHADVTAADFLVNRGTSGGSWSLVLAPPLSFYGLSPPVVEVDIIGVESVAIAEELRIEIDIDLPSLEVVASIGDVRTKVLAPMLAMDDLVVEGDFHPSSTNFVSMRYSNNGGLNWSEARMQPLGGIGEFQTSIQFRNLGQSRNKLIELSWSAPVNTSLSGATIQVETSET